MKNFFTIICTALLIVSSFSAQADESQHTYGSYDTTVVMPFSSIWNYSATQQIFSPSEVGLTGYISAIALYCTSETSAKRDIEIYIGTTDKDSFLSNGDWIPLSTLTKVYDGFFTFSSTNQRISFDIPYQYDGHKNLVLYMQDKTNESSAPSIKFLGSNKSADQSKCLFLRL